MKLRLRVLMVIQGLMSSSLNMVGECVDRKSKNVIFKILGDASTRENLYMGYFLSSSSGNVPINSF